MNDPSSADNAGPGSVNQTAPTIQSQLVNSTLLVNNSQSQANPGGFTASPRPPNAVPSPASVSTSGDPTPPLPSISSSPAHLNPVPTPPSIRPSFSPTPQGAINPAIDNMHHRALVAGNPPLYYPSPNQTHSPVPSPFNQNPNMPMGMRPGLRMGTGYPNPQMQHPQVPPHPHHPHGDMRHSNNMGPYGVVQPQMQPNANYLGAQVPSSYSQQFHPQPSQMQHMMGQPRMPVGLDNASPHGMPMPSSVNSPAMGMGTPGGAPIGRQGSPRTDNLDHLDSYFKPSFDLSKPPQEWHQEVTSELRSHLIKKIVEAIYSVPVHDPAAMQDPRVVKLIQYAIDVEKSFFENADNRDTYHKLLAERIHGIRKELDERKHISRAQGYRQQPGGGQGGPGTGILGLLDSYLDRLPMDMRRPSPADPLFKPSFVLSKPPQEWHQEVNSELRSHLIKKLVEAIYSVPVHDPAAMQDPRVVKLTQYAIDVEKSFFENADSRETYYHLLAERIYHIRKELDERKRIKIRAQVDYNRSSKLLKDHIKNQGSLNIRSLKGLFIGPARVGKTSTKRNLMGEPRGSTFSTGIDKPITVPLYHKTEASTVFIAEEWKRQDVNMQVSTIVGLASQALLIDDCPAATLPNNLPSSVMGPTPQEDTSSLQLPRVDLPADNLLSSLVAKEDWVAIKDNLKKIEDFTLFHIIDIGGQPEIHEVIPLLLHGPALNLIFFNLVQKLDEPYQITFRHEDGSRSVEYTSEFTIRQILHRVLSSISSLQYDGQGFDPTRPAALLIGTHLDQCTSEDVLDLDKSLQEHLQEAEFFTKDVLRCVDEEGKQYVFPLDNTSEKPEVIQKLRTLIVDIVKNRFSPTPTPTSWLLFHLLLRKEYEASPGWCTMDQAVEVATKCCIASDDLPVVLQFLHDSFGTILYYPEVDGLNSIVICDVNIVMKPVSDIFATTFGKNPDTVNISKEIRKSGEIPHQYIDKICFKLAGVETPLLIALFKHRYIILEIVSNNGKFYFMPSLLYPDHNVDKEATDPQLIASLSPTPLLLVPDTRCVPLGIFPALVIRLSKVWEYDRKKLFRNRICFYIPTIENYITVELRMLLGFIECRPIIKDVSLRDSSALVKCQQVVTKELEYVSSNFQHSKRVKWNHGIYCLCKGVLHPTICQPPEQPTYMSCSQYYRVPLKHKHKLWFKEMSMSESTVIHCSPQLCCGRPTLLSIRSLKGRDGKPVNVLTRIANGDYKLFGMHLLQDENEVEIDAIRRVHCNADDITLAIIKKWINDGKQCTYEHLKRSLWQSELGGLAEDIHELTVSGENDHSS